MVCNDGDLWPLFLGLGRPLTTQRRVGFHLSYNSRNILQERFLIKWARFDLFAEPYSDAGQMGCDLGPGPISSKPPRPGTRDGRIDRNSTVVEKKGKHLNFASQVRALNADRNVNIVYTDPKCTWNIVKFASSRL